MFDRADTLRWSDVVRPLSTASMALGKLAHALETTPLHPTWLWRETTRVAVTIAQASGHHAKVGPLRLALIGAPVDADDNTTGLAAARRVFLASAPLFRKDRQTDSQSELWPRFWKADRLQDDDEGGEASRAGGDGAGEEARERDQLQGLVSELAGFADDGRRPALVNLLVDLRQHAASRRLSPSLVRIALPLALLEAGLVPKAAPGLLGGRRLALGMSRATAAEASMTDWLALGLGDLAVEADQSYRRLTELTSRHRAWHAVLAAKGLRRHAKAPGALDLLAATPVLSIGLIARHLGCSHVAAGKIAERLVETGILITQTARSRHKIFVAGDLPAPTRGEADPDQPLSLSAPAAPIDVAAIGATLDGLFADLDRQTELARSRLAEEAG